MSLRDVFNKTAGKRKASKKKAATAKKKPKTSVKSKGAKKKKAAPKKKSKVSKKKEESEEETSEEEDDEIEDCNLEKFCVAATNYSPERDDPVGWIFSEKINGIRVYWSGSEFYKRNSTEKLKVPDFIKDEMPADLPLDGCFWKCRGENKDVNKIISRAAKNDSWKEISYIQ